MVMPSKFDSGLLPMVMEMVPTRVPMATSRPVLATSSLVVWDGSGRCMEVV